MIDRRDYLDAAVNGDEELVNRLLHQAIEEGRVWALVAMALSLASRDEDPATVGRLLAEAEAIARDDDRDTQIEFLKAYELMIGDQSVQGAMRMRFKHMMALAMHQPDPHFKLEVARGYGFGIGEDPPDVESARRWYALAAEAGDPHAEPELASLEARWRLLGV